MGYREQFICGRIAFCALWYFPFLQNVSLRGKSSLSWKTYSRQCSLSGNVNNTTVSSWCRESGKSVWGFWPCAHGRRNPFRNRIHKSKVFQSPCIKWPCRVCCLALPQQFAQIYFLFLTYSPIRCCILIWASFTFILNFLHAICSLTLSWDAGQAHHFPFRRQLNTFVCICRKWWAQRKQNQPLGNVKLCNKRYILRLSTRYLSDISARLEVFCCFVIYLFVFCQCYTLTAYML